jgi:hypothetical protein
MIIRDHAAGLPVGMGRFGQVDLDQNVKGDIKKIANYQELIQIRFTDPILPIADRRLPFFDQRCNLRLGFRHLLAEIPHILS